MARSNGLPISRRKRHNNCQNSSDLVREAVGCMGVFGAPVAIVWVATRMVRPHSHTPAHSTGGVGPDPETSGKTPAHGARIEPTRSTPPRGPPRAFRTTGARTTPSTTGNQHNE